MIYHSVAISCIIKRTDQFIFIESVLNYPIQQQTHPKCHIDIQIYFEYNTCQYSLSYTYTSTFSINIHIIYTYLYIKKFGFGFGVGDLCYPHPRPIPCFIIRGFPIPIPIPGQLGDSPVNSGLGIGFPVGYGFFCHP